MGEVPALSLLLEEAAGRLGDRTEHATVRDPSVAHRNSGSKLARTNQNPTLAGRRGAPTGDPVLISHGCECQPNPFSHKTNLTSPTSTALTPGRKACRYFRLPWTMPVGCL